ncbi:spermidine synthase [Actinomadura luteofluorescens]|uniref:spermidine synthase n=1 Tax=Actinomadura luteofluorescens TaxID=46163 RepID=UPI0034778290
MSVVVESPSRSERAARSGRWRLPALVGLYTLSSLVGAALLFVVQPMVTKMILPAYGGSPMVWNTAVLFFQGTLLIGYGYAHFAQRLGARKQPILHAVLILLPIPLLPIAAPEWVGAPVSAPPALWLLLVLTVMVGAPFTAVAATSPLIQRWYSWSELPRSGDPYFLYAAGNTGSLLALLSYPLFIEPAAEVSGQATWWATGYGVFVTLMAACAVVVRRAARPGAAGVPETGPAEEATAQDAGEERIGWRRRGRWLFLAFVPSSLMLGVTAHMSTDIAPVPLMWVIPLALYLVTFIVAFALRTHRRLPAAVVVSAVAAVVLPWTLIRGGLGYAPAAIALDLVLLALAGLTCHGLLAADRPSPRRLTEFFFVTSVGGALGGLFNGIVAPLVFTWTAELPVVVASLGLLPLAARWPERRIPGPALTRRVFLVTAPPTALLLCFMDTTALRCAGFALAASWTLLIARRPRVLAAVAALAVLAPFAVKQAHNTDRERTFFGQYQVRLDRERATFVHGTTVHGFQLRAPGQSMTPVSYYARRGPIGDVFAAYGARPQSGRVAVVGLGAGGLAAYGRAGQQMDFFEIDPAVVRIARDPRYFTYLRDCPCRARTIVGDGRLELQSTPDRSYGMILLDAFSSDAVPTHLLTRQAIGLYARKLAPGGVLVFNVSNRNLELAPMLGATGRAAGMATLTASDTAPKGDRLSFSSEWVAMARSADDLRPLAARSARWHRIRDVGPVWTDAHSALFELLKMNRR